MSSAIFKIEKVNGKMTDISRQIFHDQYGNLKDGKYKTYFERDNGYVVKTRYRYYFDCILTLALPRAAKVFYINRNDK